MPDTCRVAEDFLAFCIECGVLRFGEFKLKSGRISPYFFNSGLFNTGARLSRLARFYAATIDGSAVSFDMLYGPAYKGIPLVAAVSIALAEHHQRDVAYCFNRKEPKDHGEGGITVGAPLDGRVLIVDDVISAGTSTRESIDIIRAAGATPVAVAISLDRQERGQGEMSAIDEIRAEFGLEVVSIATLAQLIDYARRATTLGNQAARLEAYRERFGSAAPVTGMAKR